MDRVWWGTRENAVSLIRANSKFFFYVYNQSGHVTFRNILCPKTTEQLLSAVLSHNCVVVTCMWNFIVVCLNCHCVAYSLSLILCRHARFEILFWNDWVQQLNSNVPMRKKKRPAYWLLSNKEEKTKILEKRMYVIISRRSLDL